MSEHVIDTCVEGDGLWLPLIEYSVKTGVSLSTIRRKIKSNSIAYRLEKGRYLILHQDSQPEIRHQVPVQKTVEAPRREPVEKRSDGSTKIVADAFEFILSEKEERIRSLEKRNRELEDRVNELSTLVQVLEDKYQVRY